MAGMLFWTATAGSCGTKKGMTLVWTLEQPALRVKL